MINETKPVGLIEKNENNSKVIAPVDLPHEDFKFDIKNRNIYIEPVPLIEDKPIVWETKRPELSPMPELNLEQNEEAIKKEIISYFEKNLPKTLFHSGTLKWMNEMSTIDLVHIYDDMRISIPTRNSNVVCYNEVIASANGCNTNVPILGSVSQSKSSCFYLCGYLSKDAVPLGQSISIISEARKHVEKYTSTAEDSGTKERTVKHWMQRILNSTVSRMELFDTQATAYLLGLKGVECSDIFAYFSIWKAIDQINMFKIKKKYDTNNPDDNNSIKTSEESSMDEDESTQVDTDEESVFSDIYEDVGVTKEYENRHNGSKIYTIEKDDKKIKIPVPWEFHYKYRGKAFSTYNRHEYFCLVKVQEGEYDGDRKNETKENDQTFSQYYEQQDLKEIVKVYSNESKGRKGNAKYPFMKGHPLVDNHYQVLLSKQQTCILCGKPPPKYPGNATEKNKNDPKWIKKSDLFASYYMIGFKPNTGLDGNSSYKWKDFCKWVQISEKGNFVERMRIKTVFNTIKGLGSKKGRIDKMMLSWRGRSRHKWSELEMIEANIMNQKADKYSKLKALKQIEEITIENESKELSKLSIKEAHKCINFVSNLVFKLETLNKSYLPSKKIYKDQSSSIHNFKNHKEGISLIENIISELQSKENDVDDQNEDENDSTNSKKDDTNKYFQSKHDIDTLTQDINFGNDQKRAFYSIMQRLNEPQWSLSLVMGLPGTGKSFLINEISRIMSEKVYVQRCAVYGITAALINGCTVHHIIGKKYSEKLDAPINILDYDELKEFSQLIKKDKIGLIIIDEVSTMTTRQFHILDRRFRQVMEKDDIPFGGINVILCGDFMQNDAIGGDALYLNSLLVAKYNKDLRIPKGIFRDRSSFFPESVMQKTAEVFNEAVVYVLEEQFRIKENDPKHMKLIRKIHRGDGISQQDLDSFQFIDTKTIQKDSNWRYAPILVTSNFERAAITEQKAILFAKENNEHVFKWRLESKVVKGNASIDEISDPVNYPGLWGFFVKGAPLYITKNISIDKHIANGTKGIFHSMVFDDEEKHKYVSLIEKQTKIGQTIILDYPPDHIIVELPSNHKFHLNFNLSEKLNLIPVSMKKNSYPAKYKIWLKDRKKIRIPIQVEVTDNQGIQMAFSYTFHKAVGQTIPRVIACLSKRPDKMVQITYRLLLVALSRVTEGKYIRLLKTERDNLSYLCDLKAPEDYFIWIKGFENENDGIWNSKKSIIEWEKNEKEKYDKKYLIKVSNNNTSMYNFNKRKRHEKEIKIQQQKECKKTETSLNILSTSQFQLSQEQESVVESWFNKPETDNIIASFQSSQISQGSFNSLKPCQLLYDEVINIYCSYVISEIQLKGEKIDMFNTYFMEQLYYEGKINLENVQGYSSNLVLQDIFELDKLFIPINVNHSHWILAVIYPRQQKNSNL